MSLFRLPKLQKLASTAGTIRNRLSRKSGKGKSALERVNRRLLIDTLEERQLLTVAPNNLYDPYLHLIPDQINQILVNEEYAQEQRTIAGHAVATDGDGDFVVAWTRYDQTLDPKTGIIYDDANIYARYFTDEVQRIVLPEGVLDDATNGYASFTLDYNGNEIQTISITASHAQSWMYEDTVSGDITFGYDLDGNGSISGGETTAVVYDELDMLGSAANIQAGLRSLNGVLSGIQVRAVSPGEFEVFFGNASGGEDMDLISVVSAEYHTGYLPATLVSPYREPGQVTNIPVSPDNADMTAYAIEQFVMQTTTDTNVGPVYYYDYAADGVGGSGAYYLGPDFDPLVLRTNPIEISVSSVKTVDDPEGLRTFDITFTGNSGKINHPELEVIDVVNEYGVSLADGTVETIKETSSEFRVNAPEVDSPFTPHIDVYEQKNAAVAMDSDGDFIITWESEVPNMPGSLGSYRDIFARRFSPTGYSTVVADIAGSELPALVTRGVRGTDNSQGDFRVNENTTGEQVQPDVGVDSAGNFTIVWSTNGQQASHYNGVMVQRFNRHGERLSSEFLVNAQDTEEHVRPSITVSNDGHAVITWSETIGGGTTGWAQVLGPDGTKLINAFSPSGGAVEVTGAWDASNNFLLAWTEDSADTIGESSPGIQAQLYQLYNQSGQLAFGTLRSEFQVNTAADPILPPDDASTWPLEQMGPQAGLDADGDMVITYSGYGPDVTDEGAWYNGPYFGAEIRDGNGPIYPRVGRDIDAILDQIMIDAYNRIMQYNTTVPPIMQYSDAERDETIGLIRANYEVYFDLLRGDTNGTMFASWDAYSESSPSEELLNSDSFINADRDGRNTRYFIEIDRRTTAGGFTLRLVRSEIGGYEDITIPLQFQESVLLFQESADSVEGMLEGAQRTGLNWVPNPPLNGPIQVRILSSFELAQRAMTPDWNLNVSDTLNLVMEIVFQGDSHGSQFDMTVVDSTMKQGDLDTAPLQVTRLMDSDHGVKQHNASMSMEPDGDFVTVWTQNEE
ncbi:MAG: hypothetical protein JXM70_13760, partial [Pirellulales bacterium]|nr:hypothetical protein [Pirellulales bacterium]